MILTILDALLVICSLQCGYILGIIRGARLERIAILRHYHREFGNSPSRTLLAFVAQVLERRHLGKRDV